MGAILAVPHGHLCLESAPGSAVERIAPVTGSTCALQLLCFCCSTLKPSALYPCSSCSRHLYAVPTSPCLEKSEELEDTPKGPGRGSGRAGLAWQVWMDGLGRTVATGWLGRLAHQRRCVYVGPPTTRRRSH